MRNLNNIFISKTKTAKNLKNNFFFVFMIKETSLKTSQDEFPQQSPSFSPLNDQPPSLLTPPHKTNMNTFTRNPDSDLKTSKAYINAMKALQGKIKKLEAKLQEVQAENEAKTLESIENSHKLKQKLEEERKIFANLESNLKNKLFFLEGELNETKRALQISSEETNETKGFLQEETNKRDQDFKQFLKEKSELKEKIQVHANKISYLENLNKTFEEDLQQIRKEKLALETKNSNLHEKIRLLEESMRGEKGNLERERENLLKEIEHIRNAHNEELDFMNKEKKELYEELKRTKQENEELKENIAEINKSLIRKNQENEDLKQKNSQESQNNNNDNINNVSNHNLSNAKPRFKNYGSNIEKELFSWNTPNSKSIEKYKKFDINKYMGNREEISYEKEKKTYNYSQNAQSILIQDNNNKEKNEKNDEYQKETQLNVEKKLIFKNIQVEKTKIPEKEDLKENLRQFLKNESFSTGIVSKTYKTNLTYNNNENNMKSNDDSDYEKNISTIIDLEKDLIEMNKTYHELTEQILVIFYLKKKEFSFKNIKKEFQRRLKRNG